MAGKKSDAESFASRWANKGNENQDTQRFWIDFHQNVLGVEDAVSRLEFEKPVSTDASTHEGYIDVFIPSAKTLVEQKSLGIDLAKEETRQGRKVTPAKQGNAYAQGMPLSQQPRYIVACNFAEFWVFDRERDSLCREPLFKLPLAELPKNLAAIQFLKGGAEAPATISRAVSVEAGKIMSKLHDQVAEAFDDPDTPENHHALSVLMTRLMFLMFCKMCICAYAATCSLRVRTDTLPCGAVPRACGTPVAFRSRETRRGALAPLRDVPIKLVARSPNRYRCPRRAPRGRPCDRKRGARGIPRHLQRRGRGRRRNPSPRHLDTRENPEHCR